MEFRDIDKVKKADLELLIRNYTGGKHKVYRLTDIRYLARIELIHKMPVEAV